ncbi:MAG: FkbM family methyltransferase, partial [Oscillospiraceae bacterium]|nr:FkbM family methyltransferase [Oscillospiraceae bacterium]
GGGVVFVDRKWNEMAPFCDVPVMSPDTLKTTEFDFLVVAAQERFHKGIANDLALLGVPEEKILYPCNDLPLIALTEPTPASPWGRLSCSYHAEDFVALYTFKALSIDKPSYIDVGANDPYAGSNTALMCKHGCKGINVEADPNLISKFYKERPNDINLNVGVGAKHGTMPFYFIGEGGGSSTFSIKQAKLLEQSGRKVDKVVDIEVRTLDSIIDEYANGVYPDYLDIDVEGLDYEVLKSCNFSESTPMIICCEVKDSHHTLPEMTAMLEEKGYELYVVLSDDAIYLKKGLKEKLKITT